MSVADKFRICPLLRTSETKFAMGLVRFRGVEVLMAPAAGPVPFETTLVIVVAVFAVAFAFYQHAAISAPAGFSALLDLVQSLAVA